MSAVKYDNGKLPWSLLPVEAVEQVVAVLQNGAEKYGRHNWRLGMDWCRVYDAADRHLKAWLRGETINADSGLNHLAHAACNLLFLLSYAATESGQDDRYAAEPAANDFDPELAAKQREAIAQMFENIVVNPTVPPNTMYILTESDLTR